MREREICREGPPSGYTGGVKRIVVIDGGYRNRSLSEVQTAAWLKKTTLQMLRDSHAEFL